MLLSFTNPVGNVLVHILLDEIVARVNNRSSRLLLNLITISSMSFVILSQSLCKLFFLI